MGGPGFKKIGVGSGGGGSDTIGICNTMSRD